MCVEEALRGGEFHCGNAIWSNYTFAAKKKKLLLHYGTSVWVATVLPSDDGYRMHRLRILAACPWEVGNSRR